MAKKQKIQYPNPEFWKCKDEIDWKAQWENLKEVGTILNFVSDSVGRDPLLTLYISGFCIYNIFVLSACQEVSDCPFSLTFLNVKYK